MLLPHNVLTFVFWNRKHMGNRNPVLTKNTQGKISGWTRLSICHLVARCLLLKKSIVPVKQIPIPFHHRRVNTIHEPEVGQKHFASHRSEKHTNAALDFRYGTIPKSTETK
jgi:hypothetical protein